MRKKIVDSGFISALLARDGWASFFVRHEKMRRKKHRQWFPRITDDEYGDKLFDECKAFLEIGGDSFSDLNP